MKKLWLILVLILTLSLFVSCGNPGGEVGGENGGDTAGENTGGENNGGETVVELVDLRELGYTVVCNMSDTGAFDFTQDLINAYKDKFNETITKKPQNSKESQYEIVVGEISSRSESADVALDVYLATTPRVGVGIMRMIGDKLIVNASSAVAYSMLSDKLIEYINGENFEIPKELDYVIYYDAIIFDESSTIVTYEAEEINSVSYPAWISLNGKPMSEFRTKTFRYELDTNFALGYPEISAEPGVVGATVEVTQPTEENGGVATVTATSLDGKENSTYVISFTMNDYYNIASEVVIKDGKKGTVTVVIDDGQQATASNVVDIFKKYPSVKAGFAIPTKTLANLKIDTDTNTYVIDENGRYVYTRDEGAWAFWTNLLKDTRFEAISHSHTHSYWGDDDNGGSYVYTKNDGTVLTSEEFPKGNVTKELAASKQIIEDLGQRSLTFIKPGVGAKLSQYYFDMLESGLYYIGARTTASNPKAPSRMLNYVPTYDPYTVKAYMVQHYDTTPDITTESTAAECVAADITYWKDYINAAVAEGGWAAFCIHNIVDDSYASTHGGHYIYKSQADKLFGYIENLSANLWIASYTDATIYYNQWSSATVTAEAYRDEYIKVNLSHKEVGDCYDMEMTVKLSVPSSWSSATVGDKTVEVKTDEDMQKFIYVDVKPGVELTVQKGSN